MASYGWIITNDHLFGDEPGETVAGLSGPRGSEQYDQVLDVENKGKNAKGIAFDLYDDDGEHYVSGRLVFEGWERGETPDEDILAGPLRDYGRPGMGAVRCEFPDQPSWTVEM